MVVNGDWTSFRNRQAPDGGSLFDGDAELLLAGGWELHVAAQQHVSATLQGTRNPWMCATLSLAPSR